MEKIITHCIILYVKDKEVQTGFSPSPVEHFIHVPFCRDPREIASEQSILQPEQHCANSNQRYPSQRTESPMQSLQYTCTKGYGYKKTEVYNPGKARRLEVYFQLSTPLIKFSFTWQLAINNRSFPCTLNSDPGFSMKRYLRLTTPELVVADMCMFQKLVPTNLSFVTQDLMVKVVSMLQ